MDSHLDELVRWLDDHTNFELDAPGRADIPTLERVVRLCESLGDPQLAVPVIHVTGTNGKGSTSQIITQLLRAKGLSVGTYSSPDLGKLNERISRDSCSISDVELVEILGSLQMIEQMLGERPSRFELLSVAAFMWFADVAVDVAVVEVGLGGRWDATNVVKPEVAVLTNISYDHVELLGPSLMDIAREKAGIIKPGCRLVVGEKNEELVKLIRDTAKEVGIISPWFSSKEFEVISNSVATGGRLLDLRTPGSEYSEIFLSLHGKHQGENAAVALAAVEAFFESPMKVDLVEEAMRTVEFPGRMEVVDRSPLVILDGAHNVAGATALAFAIDEEFHVEGTKVAVVGMLSGRDPSAILQALVSCGLKTVIACSAPSSRAIPGSEISDSARAIGLDALLADSVSDAVALGRARIGDDGMLIITGSLYVVAAAREFLGVPSR